MVIPLLPTAPPGLSGTAARTGATARTGAAGKPFTAGKPCPGGKASAAGDFAADLDAVLVGVDGLAALLGVGVGVGVGGAVPAGPTSPLPTAQAAAPTSGLPPGAGAAAAALPGAPAGPGSPNPAVEAAVRTSGLPSGTGAAATAAAAPPARPGGAGAATTADLPAGVPGFPVAERPGAQTVPVTAPPGVAAAASPGPASTLPAGDAPAPTSRLRSGAGTTPGLPAGTPEPARDLPRPTGTGTETRATAKDRVPDSVVGSATFAAPSSTGAVKAASAAPAAPEPPVSSPAVPVRIADLARRRSGTVEQLVIRLDPPELGSVHISVTARGEDVRVALRAATPEARAALAAQRDTIESLLSGEGFDLSSFDVGHQTPGDGRQDGRRPGAGGRRAPFALEAPADPSPIPSPAADGALRL